MESGGQNKRNLLVHVLFRGNNTSEVIGDEYVEEFRRRNLIATTVPILNFNYKNIDELAILLRGDGHLKGRRSPKGLIITSPRVVEALYQAKQLLISISKEEEEKEEEFNILVKLLDSRLIFVVGQKSGRECKDKLEIDYNEQSAECGNGQALSHFIKTFCNNNNNTNTTSTIKLVYPKSSLSDNSIEEELAGECELQPLVVYETVSINDVDKILLERISMLNLSNKGLIQKLVLNMVFFSPSGLDSYIRGDCERVLKEHFAQENNSFANCTLEIKYSSIGRTTENALLRNNLQVFCVSEKPNPKSLVDSIIDKI